MNGIEKAGTTALLLISFGALSCRNVGGIFPGGTEESNSVSLAELAAYYEQASEGLVRINPQNPENVPPGLNFVWDPYEKRRVLAPFRMSSDVIQGLFHFDAPAFVRASASGDFLSAAERYYRSRPFDERKQSHIRPYRCLAHWGSLFYPPLQRLTEPLPFYHRQFSPFDERTVTSEFFDPQFQVQIDEESQTELTYGNTLRALFNGVESYPQKLRLAGEAKRFLYVAVMTMVADSTGQEMIRILVNRKRAGVDVRLITDDFYTFSISSFAVGILEREGIPVAYVKDKRLNQLDRMFHNKFWIRDGEEAILGGMNVLDYENEANGFNFLNRDTDLLISGPAVTSLVERFIALWKRYDRAGVSIASAESTMVHRRAEEVLAGIRGKENYARWLGNPETRMDGICRVAIQGDNAEPQNIATILGRYFGAAEHSIYFTSPEVEFDLSRIPPARVDTLAGILLSKARTPGFFAAYITNGLDGGLGESTAFLRSRVRDSQIVGDPLWEDMLTPIIDREGRNVNRRVRSTMKPLIDAGLHGYQYFNYMHAKEIYLDRLLVGIGSWNFDSYSAENNHESMIFCLDSSLREQVERQMVLDMVNAVPIVFPGDSTQSKSMSPGGR